MKRLTLCILLCILVAACCACRPTTPLSGEERLAMEAVRAAQTDVDQQGTDHQELLYLTVQAGRQPDGTLVFQVRYRLANLPSDQPVRSFYQIAGTVPNRADPKAARLAYRACPIRYQFNLDKLLLAPTSHAPTDGLYKL